MSGRWMTASDRFTGYRHDVKGARGDGRVSPLVVRSVLHQLCRIAHDAGIAQISVQRLCQSTGASPATVKRALKRLAEDGVIVRAVKGTGNRVGTDPRQSVWVIRQLPDIDGAPWPSRDWLAEQFARYADSDRWGALNSPARRVVRSTWHDLHEFSDSLEAFTRPVENAESEANKVSVTPQQSVSADPHSQGQPQFSGGSGWSDWHRNLEAKKRRGRMRVLPDSPSDSLPPNGAQTGQADVPDRATQLAALERQAKEERNA